MIRHGIYATAACVVALVALAFGAHFGLPAAVNLARHYNQVPIVAKGVDSSEWATRVARHRTKVDAVFADMRLGK